MNNNGLHAMEPSSMPHRPQVALVDLPPVYRRGLGAGLTEAGFVVHQPSDVVAWAREGSNSKIAVTTDNEPALDLLDSVRIESPAVVTVALLEEATLASYSRALPRCTGAVPLHAELEDVLVAIRAAANGYTLVPVDVARLLAARGESGADLPELSERELGWLRALADNVTVFSLARSSGYSEREMYRLLSALYERLGATTRTGALLRADRLGLLRSSVPAQLSIDSAGTASRGGSNGRRGK